MNTKKLILASAVCAFLVACGGGSDAGPGVGPNLTGGVSGVTGISGSAVGTTPVAINSSGTGGSYFDGGNAVEGTTAIHIPGIGVTSPDGLSGIDTTNPSDGSVLIAGELENFRGEEIVLKMNSKIMTIERKQKGFKFEDTLTPGAKYKIEIESQPFAPTQQCEVKGGEGEASADMPKIEIVCEAAVKHVYTSNRSDKNVSSYLWNDSNSLLTDPVQIGPITTSYEILSLVKNPVKSAVYAATKGAVFFFDVKEKEAELIPVTGGIVGLGFTASFGADVIVHPNGERLYVQYGDQLGAYKLNGLGGLADGSVDLKSDLASIGGIAANMGVSTDTLHEVYVWAPDGKVMRISLDVNGKPNRKSVAIEAGEGIKKLVFDPSGKFAYAINDKLDSVIVYSVLSDGEWTIADKQSLPNTDSFDDLAIDPRGGWLYTVGGAQAKRTNTDLTRWKIESDGKVVKNASITADGLQDRIAAIHPMSGDLYLTGADVAYLLRANYPAGFTPDALSQLPSDQKQTAILLY